MISADKRAAQSYDQFEKKTHLRPIRIWHSWVLNLLTTEWTDY